MKKLITSTLLLATTFIGGPAVLGSDTIIPLFAGQHDEVGLVRVSNETTDDGNYLTVSYELTDSDWRLGTTHLYVGDNRPRKLSPGRFPYKHENLDCVSSDEYLIDLDVMGISSGDNIYIAAHGEVSRITGREVDWDGFLDSLPLDTIELTVSYPASQSLFYSTVNGAGDLDGVYDGFCVDLARTIYPGEINDTYMVSSYSIDAQSLVDRPENLPLLNYFINQDYVAMGYSIESIQTAVWRLMDNDLFNWKGYSEVEVQSILADVYLNGVDFVPAYNQKVVVIFNPVDENGITNAQVNIAGFDLPYTTTIEQGHETVWALSDNGHGCKRGWGSYFKYTVE